MKILTETDPKYKEIELHVCSDALTDEVRAVVGELHEIYDRSFSATDSKGNRKMIRTAEIISVHSEGPKVFILAGGEMYSVQLKLYEIEKELGERDFVRISKSELVNIHKIRSLDLSITGTIKLVMRSGYETYVSRRNVTRIKERLMKEAEAEHA